MVVPTLGSLELMVLGYVGMGSFCQGTNVIGSGELAGPFFWLSFKLNDLLFLANDVCLPFNEVPKTFSCDDQNCMLSLSIFSSEYSSIASNISKLLMK